MKSILTSVLLATASIGMAHAADLVPGKSYYIINDFYGKLLGQDANGTAPSLSVNGKVSNADSYVFVAEASGTNGYVYLKQKSSGKYLAASGSNDWSIVYESTKGTADRFLWKVGTGLKTRITNKKNTDKRLGCDWNNTEFESAYYNKGAGVMNFWSVIPTEAGPDNDYSNVRGTMERDYYTIGTSKLTLSDAIDLHIYSEANPISAGGGIDICNDRGWVIFDNCTPTNVKTNYLKYITVNGQPAVLDENVRIAIYLNGAAVIPCTKDEVALTGYTDLNYTGEALTFTNGNTKDLVEQCNSIRSFKLRRGYMATLASGKNGRGYSRVYVADHADIEVKDLPEALDMRISSIHVKRWQYTSKKGFGGSSNNAYRLRCGWNYNWDANSTSSIDVEYIPIRQHRYWPSMSNVNGKEASTATLSINEPDHPEQHEGCSCNGTMNAWTATTITPDFLPAGSRIGSPAPTDQGWLKEYFGHIDDMAYRCDFSVTHGYWGPNDANGTSGWNNRINSIYNDTKRPLWITEWEYGSSWYSDQSIYSGTVNDMAKKTLEILDALETNSHLERYAYYNTDSQWKLHCWYDEGGISPVGEAYRYVKSDFAYKASEQKVPNYWTPSLQKPAVKDVILLNGKYSIKVENGNDDFTNSLTIEKKNSAGEWSELYTCTERWMLDDDTQTFTVEPSDISDAAALRVKITTNAGKSSQSDEYTIKIDYSDYTALADLKNLDFNEGTNVSKPILTYAKDIKNGEYSGMRPVEGWTISENGDARAAGQFQWGSKQYLGGSTYLMPATDADKGKEGGALGILAVWTATAQYTQKVMLPAGKYTITMPVYNMGGTGEMDKNLCGIILADGTEYLAKTKKYTEKAWTTETIEFELTGDTPAMLTLGYTSTNSGSGSMPHLAIDGIRIKREYTEPEPPVTDNPADVNGDGMITIEDITELINLYLTQ